MATRTTSVLVCDHCGAESTTGHGWFGFDVWETDHYDRERVHVQHADLCPEGWAIIRRVFAKSHKRSEPEEAQRAEGASDAE